MNKKPAEQGNQVNAIVRRLTWYVKQIFPFIYISTYMLNHDGEKEVNKRQLCIWRMWLGRCFNVRYFDLAA